MRKDNTENIIVVVNVWREKERERENVSNIYLYIDEIGKRKHSVHHACAKAVDEFGTVYVCACLCLGLRSLQCMYVIHRLYSHSFEECVTSK